MYKVQVNHDLCIGSGDCVAIASKTFGLDSEMKSVIKKQNADSDQLLMQAAHSCPIRAIVLTNDSGTQIYP